MSKAGYIGVESAGRKAKKVYFGVDGVARKVKKGYIGVDGVARLWFSAGTRITYTGAYMRQAVTNGGTEYNLYTLLTSGTLSVEGDPVDYWMCGGGGGGANSTKVLNSGAGNQINTIHSTGGGAGAYAENGQVIGNGIAVLIGAGGRAESNGGASTLGDATANGGGAAPTTVYVNNYYGRDAVMGGSGGTGGGSTLVYTSSEVNMGIGGSGDGKSKIPFEISALKAHCAGGGGGAHYYEVDKSAYATGGAGGSNGSDGSTGAYATLPVKGGAGGEYGGGAGANASGNDDASNDGKNATFYGGGGGGVAYYETSSKQHKGTTAGKGYQGVVYLMVPKEIDESEEPVTPYKLTITGADRNSYVQTGGTNYTSATEMYVNNGQSVTVYAYGRYNTIKANGTTVASNSSYKQKTISYTFEVSASTTIAFSSGSATITY